MAEHKALSGLWQVFVLSGADTDGDSQFYCSLDDAVLATVDAVTELRDTYDALLKRLEGQG